MKLGAVKNGNKKTRKIREVEYGEEKREKGAEERKRRDGVEVRESV